MNRHLLLFSFLVLSWTLTSDAIPIVKTNSYESNPAKAYWVYLTDKNLDRQQASLLLKSVTRNIVTERSLARRRRIRPADKLLDQYDLPVSPQYVEKIISRGVKFRTRSRWFNAISILATPAQIRQIRGLSFVTKIEPVAVWKATPPARVQSDAISSSADAIQNHRLDYGPSLQQLELSKVPALHDIGLTGEGLLICALDVGFRTSQHEALSAANILHEWDFLENDGDTDGMQASHGTLVLAVAAAFKEGQLIGSGYGADFMIARTEDASLEFLEEEDLFVAALEWADSLGADIITSSLINNGLHPFSELDGKSSIASVAAGKAASRGMLLLNGVGNSGPQRSTLLSPADADNILAIGATTLNGTLADFSSRGPTADGRIKPEVTAAGQSVYSVVFGSTTGYQRVDGTSFATPLTAGIAALVWQNHPQWGPLQVREALMMTAENAGSANNNSGWGLVDAVQAAFYKSIGGYISHANTKAPLADISISYTGPISGTVETGENGRYLIENLEAGTYELTASAQGFETTSRTVTVPKWIMNADFELAGSPVHVGSDPLLPTEIELNQNYPNPFNPATTIRYRMPRTSFISLAVFDIQGRLIKTLVHKTQTAGEKSIAWRGENEYGQKAASGLYIYQLSTANFVASHKMLLLK